MLMAIAMSVVRVRGPITTNRVGVRVLMGKVRLKAFLEGHLSAIMFLLSLMDNAVPGFLLLLFLLLPPRLAISQNILESGGNLRRCAATAVICHQRKLNCSVAAVFVAVEMLCKDTIQQGRRVLVVIYCLNAASCLRYIWICLR